CSHTPASSIHTFSLHDALPISIMQQKLGLTVAGSSVWMIATIIGMSIGMLTFGSILDYFGPRRAFGIFLLASAIAVFSITLAVKDRKSTRLNSSHVSTSYAVFC